MSHSKVHWKLKPKPKEGHRRLSWPVCPLCGEAIFPDMRKRVMWQNRHQVLVHDKC